jgi:hypothetical protein
MTIQNDQFDNDYAGLPAFDDYVSTNFCRFKGSRGRGR